MKKKILISFLVLLTCFAYTGCGENKNTENNNLTSIPEASIEEREISEAEDIVNEEVNEEVNENEDLDPEFNVDYEEEGDEVIKENPSFSYNHNIDLSATIIDELQKTEKNSNVTLSETSLNYALGMIYEGSAGDTKNQLYDYISREYKLTSDDEISDILKNGMEDYKNRDDVQINIANSLWINDGFNVKDTYVKTLNDRFMAYSEIVDMSGPETVNLINNWCKDATEEKIESIVKKEDLQNAETILVNALYFNGNWKEEFKSDAIYEGTFNNSDGTTKDVTMLRGSVNGYLQNDKAEGFVKFYNDDKVAYIGILPKTAGEYNLSDLDINSLLSSYSNKEVEIALPKYRVETNVQLQDVLRTNGLDSLFDGADFSNISEESLAINKIIQKTYIDVNEKGTEASAATAVIMQKGIDINKTKIVLDRPFTYLIYDTQNNEILFLGKLNNL